MRLERGRWATMRNTDRDWQQIAEEAPYFSVLVNEKFRNPTMSASGCWSLRVTTLPSSA